uniref:APC family permease n=1 Tax=Altererythrobacter segetis TaxID=1104773 RepID=UPI00140C8240|nr:amino acid permease [Altererythrobacter segetis]
MTDHVHSQSLLRVLGLAFGIAVVVGGAVGQGIMRTPGIVASAVPDPTLILLLWALGGGLALVDGLVVMELGAALPCSGGPYAFARRAFGNLSGIMLGWADWLQGMFSAAFMAVVFGEYLQRLGVATQWPRGLLSALLLLMLWAIHIGGTKVGAASQLLGTALKGLGLVVLAALLFSGPTAAAAPAGEITGLPPALGLAAIAIAIRSVFMTYAGWNATIYFCEEMRDPTRHVVRATFIGILLVTALYVLMNAAMLHVLSPAEMAASNLPAADALARVLGGRSDTVVTLLALLSVGAIANLTIMQFTRTAYGVARDGALPLALTRVSANGTPRLALTTTAMAALLLAVAGGYEALLAMAAPVNMLINLVVDIAAIRLRLSEPDLPRPFRMPLYPLPALVAGAINAALLVAVFWEDPGNSSIGFTALLAIGAVYLLRGRFAPAVVPA